MSPSADQVSAFTANSGFQMSDCTGLLEGAFFVGMLLWGVWAMHAAYVGWAEQQISARQFLAVIVRFLAMYLTLTFLLLS